MSPLYTTCAESAEPSKCYMSAAISEQMHKAHCLRTVPAWLKFPERVFQTSFIRLGRPLAVTEPGTVRGTGVTSCLRETGLSHDSEGGEMGDGWVSRASGLTTGMMIGAGQGRQGLSCQSWGRRSRRVEVMLS